MIQDWVELYSRLWKLMYEEPSHRSKQKQIQDLFWFFSFIPELLSRIPSDQPKIGSEFLLQWRWERKSLDGHIYIYPLVNKRSY